MDYYRTLHLEREPFSNSPDPGLFFNSRQHLEALQKLEISIRLRRGLNIVTGDVGTGKTTLSRQLIQSISHDPGLRYFLILDPGFSTTRDFLSCMTGLFTGPVPDGAEEAGLKEEIKKYLFAQGVDHSITTVLLIDEGQKLPVFCLEILRELLNYETNDHKLLQIVIFAQKEFDRTLLSLDNFNDRINFRYTLSPLGFFETKELIKFRLEKSSAQPVETPPFFSFFAYIAVYRYTRGFPRKIINLCHHIMIRLIIQNRKRADYGFVRACAKEVFLSGRPWKLRLALSALVCLMFMAGGAYMFKLFQTYGLTPDLWKAKPPAAEQPVVRAEIPAPPAPETTIPEAAISETAPPVETVAPAETAPQPQALTAEEIQPQEPAQPAEPALPPETAAKSDEPDESVETVSPPEFYNAFRVPKDDTLYRLMEIVYGSYRTEYVEKVMKANPRIKDPNQIIAGMVMQFPVISGTYSLWANNPFCIRLSTEDDFTKAVESVKHYRQRDVDVRILPSWDPGNGFLFSVVINKAFDSLAAAGHHKEAGVKQGVCERIFDGNDGRKPL